MLFNTFEFFLFFGVVFGLYVVIPHRWQNRLLLVASYYFYSCWDWRFLSLILISTVADFFLGLKIQDTNNVKIRRRLLIASLAINLGILGFFKYFHFFTNSLYALFNQIGIPYSPLTLTIILPMGISFYTFQTMSYTIDIYRNRMEATRNFSDFALFVAFFPQLVAGPIERAQRLLPQVQQPRQLSAENIYEGGYLIFWGLFMKIFIADNLARIVDPIFAGPTPDGQQVLLGIYAFAFQIFCDFAGYSSIARGLGKMLGFDIILNFNLPYFATNPRDFWRRWHISLSTWLRDYLYIPLGGNKQGSLLTYRNLFLTMLLGGLWHGAAWTYVLWGCYQGALLMMHRLTEHLWPKFKAGWPHRLNRLFNMIVFFHLVCMGWMIFRAQSVGQIGEMLQALLTNFGGIPQWHVFQPLIFFTAPLLVVQLAQYFGRDLMIVYKAPAPVRALFYFGCYVLIVLFGVEGGKEFIYFQF